LWLFSSGLHDTGDGRYIENPKLRGTEAFERSAPERRNIEMLFAHLQRNLNFRRLRLRGMTGGPQMSSCSPPRSKI
jgi:hypothetical protein